MPCISKPTSQVHKPGRHSQTHHISFHPQSHSAQKAGIHIHSIHSDETSLVWVEGFRTSNKTRPGSQTGASREVSLTKGLDFNLKEVWAHSGSVGGVYVKRWAVMFRTDRSLEASSGDASLVILKRPEIPEEEVMRKKYFIYRTHLQFTKDFCLNNLVLPSEQFVRQNMCHFTVRTAAQVISFHDCSSLCSCDIRL